MRNRKLVKSDAEQFEIDEKLIDELSNADEFKDVELTADDVMDAIQAIDALADAVIEKADEEEKKLDADMLLDEIRDMIDENHDEEEEIKEEEELPEELTNAAVRVMVSEDGAIELEQTPDEVYDSEIDGLECTVYDTVDIPEMEIEDTGSSDDLLVIGNSKSKSFKKGFLKISSSVSKKAWSSAYKKVKKMIGSSKLTAAHWAIVSAIAKKEEEKNKLKKKIECAIIKAIRSNKSWKAKLLKSDFSEDVAGQTTQEDIDDASTPSNETKPEETVGEGNPGYDEGKKPTDMESPEIVDSQSGNPVEDPDTQVEKTVPVVEEDKVELEVFLANSKRTVKLEKILTNHLKNFSAYKAVNVPRALYNALDGKVVKNGKDAFMFKDTANGLIACAANFINVGKGHYTTVLKNGRIVITKGSETKVFNNIEKIMIGRAIVSARHNSIAERKREIINSHRNINSSRRPVVNSKREAILSKIKSERKIEQARKDLIRTKIELQRELMHAKMVASRNEAKLRSMHEAEERERLFQASQNAINEEKIAIKQGMSRNTAALESMYDKLF